MIFELTDKEKIAAKIWIEKHLKKCKFKNDGAIGGRISYVFTPTGIGTCVKVKCFCGKCKSITDFDTW